LTVGPILFAKLEFTKLFSLADPRFDPAAEALLTIAEALYSYFIDFEAASRVRSKSVIRSCL
jgi:hypothetical protein